MRFRTYSRTALTGVRPDSPNTDSQFWLNSVAQSGACHPISGCYPDTPRKDRTSEKLKVWYDSQPAFVRSESPWYRGHMPMAIDWLGHVQLALSYYPSVLFSAGGRC